MTRKGLRPEHTGPAPALYDADASRYHSQNAGIQADMAAQAICLLCLQPAAAAGPAALPWMLADLGCGSGLSACAVRRIAKHAWLGLDITREMLRIAAARQPGCSGHVAMADLGQGLPLRPSSLDGAISISAVQWLCTGPDAQHSIRRFFRGLRHALQPGARAALQVYTEGGQAQQLVAGALCSGLDAGLFVCFPHATAAKKYFVLVRRPWDSGCAGSQGAHLSAHACSLAWPRGGTCMLSWVRLCQQGQQQLGEDLLASAARLQREHGAHAKHILRVMRRAERLAAGDGSAAGEPCGSAAADAAAGTCVLQAEVGVSQPALQPCGGIIFVLFTATAELLSSCGEGGPGADQPAAAAGADPALRQGLVARATALVQQLVCPPAGSTCEPQTAAIKEACEDDALLHRTKPPLSPFRAPPAPSSNKAHQYMRLEPLPLPAGDVQHGREDAESPLAAVLHAHKKAQHLLLRFSWRRAEHPAKRWQGMPSANGNTERCHGGSAGSEWWCSGAAAAAVGRLSAFCREASGCVVALDAHVHCDRVDATWVLHMNGLQGLDRAQLAANISTHFRPPGLRPT